jgi:hypothetical protein
MNIHFLSCKWLHRLLARDHHNQQKGKKGGQKKTPHRGIFLRGHYVPVHS